MRISLADVRLNNLFNCREFNLDLGKLANITFDVNGRTMLHENLEGHDIDSRLARY